MKTTNPIGILGGTFNPIHLGHLQIASYLDENYTLDEIKFIPCYQPVHRTKPEVTPQQRIEMVKIAIEEYPRFTLDLREIERQTPSYSIDTLRSLAEQFPYTPLWMIIGLDAFNKINTWKAWLELLDYAHFLVVKRANINMTSDVEIVTLLKQHQTDNTQDLYSTKAGKILLLDMEPISISATDIRERLHNHLPVGHLLPKGVSDYIRHYDLYSGKTTT